MGTAKDTDLVEMSCDSIARIVGGLEIYPKIDWTQKKVVESRSSRVTNGEHFKGIDIMRAGRRFDPCLLCGVQMYAGAGTTLTRMHMPHAFSGQRTTVTSALGPSGTVRNEQ